jgi:shikimate 5-dehydrogenase
VTTESTALGPAPGELPWPAQRPTFSFVGVTTGRSSIRTVFPPWAQAPGLGDVPPAGVDLPLHAPRVDERRIVGFLAGDPLGSGALVTTQEIDLCAACGDQFAQIDPLARLVGEVGCLAEPDGALVASAMDAVTAGLALDVITPPGSRAAAAADALVLGAGGSATAISWCPTRPERCPDRSARIVVTDPDRGRLDALRRVHEELGTGVPVETRPVEGAGDDDALLAAPAPGSLVVNATGPGKDAPGSPLTDSARFPAGAVAWDLDHRGELVFLDQARAGGAVVQDGREYVPHGGTRVIAEVFQAGICA